MEKEMKKISILEATPQQIIEYIKNNPDEWTLGKLIDDDEQVYKAMEDPSWEDLFQEAVYMYPEDYDVDYDEDDCVDMESEKTKKEFKNYLKCSMNGFDEFLTEYDIDIEVGWRGDIFEVIYSHNGKELDNEIILSGKNIKIEVEEKIYIVWQDKSGCYHSDDYSDKLITRLNNDDDVIRWFEANEGATWFEQDTTSITLYKNDIEEAGYTLEDLYDMSPEETYKAVCEIHSDIESVLIEWEPGITQECEEGPNEVCYIEDNGDEVDVTLVVKFKFKMSDGVVEMEMVK
jgi:hypothetical protein